ncbi:unnamed protein product [Bursaphelenchus okinawaensis]|uniref:DUF7754 domain-containing protein n=1 Tax=Bursaphelenchus okinawaensis TaxID=465554 RepID=A0A811JWZ4_9BILA|nr:unnamed protein product [Bursaphelenchus okinawaensis]CAG9086312.1 unnamed protein product [Bursaphelenchus okinawaensis]
MMDDCYHEELKYNTEYLNQLSIATCPDDYEEFAQAVSNTNLQTGLSDPEVRLLLEEQEKINKAVMALEEVDIEVPKRLGVSINCDGEKLLYDDTTASENEYSYFFKDLYLKFILNDAEGYVEVRTDYPTSYTEWEVVAQVRFSTSTNLSSFKVVDGAVFSFGKYDRPVRLELDHSEGEINAIRVDMRLIRYNFEKVSPSFFRDTDVTITFDDGKDDIYSYKNFLQLYSFGLANMIKQSTEFDAYANPIIHLPAEDRPLVTELLVYLGPNIRPIHPRFVKLCHAAKKYASHTVLIDVAKYFLQHCSPYMSSLTQRVTEAIHCNLGDVVIPKLMFDAVKNKEWSKVISQVSEPSTLFSEDVYNNFVAPACIQAQKKRNFEFPTKEQLTLRARSANDPNVVKLTYSGVTVLAHKGVLQAQSMAKFGTSSDLEAREYYPIFSVATREYLQKLHINLEHFLNEFLDFAYYGKGVCNKCIKPMLIFAHDNELKFLKAKMEEAIMGEPPITSTLLKEHLVLASKYNLENLMRLSLLRSEGHYLSLAQALINMTGVVNELSLPTMRKLADRLCSGWSLVEWKMAERNGTRKTCRRLFLGRGGPMERILDPTLESFYELTSEVAFGPTIE